MLSRLRDTKFISYNFDPCEQRETGVELCQCLFEVYDDITNNPHIQVNGILRNECCTFSCINEDIKSQLERRLDTSLSDDNITTNSNEKSCTINDDYDNTETFNFNYDNTTIGCYYELSTESPNSGNTNNAIIQAVNEVAQSTPGNIDKIKIST